MGNPITWRNVNVQNSGGGQLLESGAKLMSSGLGQFRGVINDKIQDKTDRNTQAFLDQVNSYKTADELGAGADDLAALRSSFGRYVDPEAIRGAESDRGDAIQARLNKERDQLLSDQNFEDAQTTRGDRDILARLREQNNFPGAMKLFEENMVGLSPQGRQIISQEITAQNRAEEIQARSDNEHNLKQLGRASTTASDQALEQAIAVGDYNSGRSFIDALVDSDKSITSSDAVRIRGLFDQHYDTAYKLGPEAEREVATAESTALSTFDKEQRDAQVVLNRDRSQLPVLEVFNFMHEGSPKPKDPVAAAQALGYNREQGWFENIGYDNTSEVIDQIRSDFLREEGIGSDPADLQAIDQLLTMAVEKQGEAPALKEENGNDDLDETRLYADLSSLFLRYRKDKANRIKLNTKEDNYTRTVDAAAARRDQSITGARNKAYTDTKARNLFK
jgi:hypothetical protein